MRQEAEAKKQEAGGRGKEAGGRRQRQRSRRQRQRGRRQRQYRNHSIHNIISMHSTGAVQKTNCKIAQNRRESSMQTKARGQSERFCRKYSKKERQMN